MLYEVSGERGYIYSEYFQGAKLGQKNKRKEDYHLY
jgi:hypothetical protein